jgi:hypothetical protein
MKRLLALLLSLAIVGAAAATPALACVSKATVGDRQHGCCGEGAVVTAPAGTCCFLSQPTNERTLTESRSLNTQDRDSDVANAGQPIWLAVPDTSARRRAGPSSPPTLPVPIYIRQLSLLI